VLSPTLGELAFWCRIAVMLIIAAVTFACYFGINRPLPFLFRYSLGRMQLYLCLSDVVWQHMGIKTGSEEHVNKLRDRAANSDFNGIQDAIMTFFAARLYISVCGEGRRYLKIDEIEEDFAAIGLLKGLWAYQSKIQFWKFTDLLILAHRQTLQGYEKGSKLHRRIFRRFADLEVVKETGFVASQAVIANLAREEVNATGTRTMVLIGGGFISDLGINVQPLEEHPDYKDFIKKATLKGWRILALHGQEYLGPYYDAISSLVKDVDDRQKPILVGHSAGAVVALDYLKDRNRESWFEKTILFNCPLVYPRVDNPALRACYRGTERVNADSLLVMSKNDFIMDYSVEGISMMEAIDIVRQAGKVQVQVLDQPDYVHGPFDVGVAWKIISQYPAEITLRAAMSLRIQSLKSPLRAIVEGLRRRLRL